MAPHTSRNAGGRVGVFATCAATSLVGLLVLFRPRDQDVQLSWQDMAHEPHECPEGAALFTSPSEDGWLRACRSVRTWREDGPTIQWRAGRPRVVGRYRDGVRVGTWRTLDQDGRVVDEVDHGERD